MLTPTLSASHRMFTPASRSIDSPRATATVHRSGVASRACRLPTTVLMPAPMIALEQSGQENQTA